MKTLYSFDFVNKTIVASKTTLKKASKPGSPEYKELMKMIAKQPTFTVVEKEININENKRTYNGLTFDVMEAYISKQSDAETKAAEYQKVKKMGKYPLVKSWFLNEYPNFKMSEAKKTACKVRVAKAVA